MALFTRHRIRKKLLSISKTRSDLEYCSPALNKRTSCNDTKNLNHIKKHLTGLRFGLSAFLQCTCFLNAVLEHSRSDLVFEHCLTLSRLSNKFISVSCG